MSGTFITFGNFDYKFPTMANAILECISILPKPVVVQAGSSLVFFKTTNFEVHEYIPRDKYLQLISQSEVVITHAGVGSLAAANKLSKYPCVFARKYELNEHIDDHQLELVKFYSSKSIFFYAKDSNDIRNFLNHGLYRKIPEFFETKTKAVAFVLDSFIRVNILK